MKGSRIGLALAVAATLFAGVLIGVGNMVHLAVTPAAAEHAHHGHHADPENADALAPILTLPAHCLFCLDGMVPQPVSVPHGAQADAGSHVIPTGLAPGEDVPAPEQRLHHCREPPDLLS